MTAVTLPRFASLNADDIVALRFENAGAAKLEGGVTSFGQVFAAGDLPAGTRLVAEINGQKVAVQMDVKTTYADGSVKMAVLSMERPDLAAGASADVVLTASHDAAPAAAAVNLVEGLKGHSFVVDVTADGGATTHVDVLGALQKAIGAGTASFWQKGEFATEARVEIDMPGSQRMVFDVTAFKDGGFSVDASFNNDGAMQANGGNAAYRVTVTMDGEVVTAAQIAQTQYQNWHQSYASNSADGGQGLGSPDAGWLNIQHDTTYLVKAGAVANYDLSTGVDQAVLSNMHDQVNSAGWGEPLATNGVTQDMTGTGARDDIGFTTEANTAWLMTQDARAAAYALGQAETASSIPWHFWDAKNGTWVNTENYPNLWLDARGGTGAPGDASSGTLTQGIDGSTGWIYDTAHQPDLSYVAYLQTGERWVLDNVMSQASASILQEWPDFRHNEQDLVVNGGQVRSDAWSLRQIDEAAFVAPDGSAEQSYFKGASETNWSYIVSMIPEWTAAQGEAHGWIPGDYGVEGAMPPWQQDMFASTAIAAAKHGNQDAVTYLEWASNFLVGRFFQEGNGFAEHDGAAYLIATDDPDTGAIYKTWQEIGQHTVERDFSNGEGWSKMDGNYGQLALATLSGIYEVTGNEQARQAYHNLVADGIPYTDGATFAQDPTYNIAAPGQGQDTVLPPAALPDHDTGLGGSAPVVETPEVAAPEATPPKAPAHEVTVPGTAAGADTLVLKISEQAWKGHAQYTVSVDGKQVGGVHTASANHWAGETETVTLKGDWDHGAHKISVTFLNDAQGAGGGDRNLFVDGISFGGKEIAHGTAELWDNGSVNFTAAATAAAPAKPAPSAGSGTAADSLVLKVSGQSWEGDAQFTVSVDGKQVGGIHTTSADHWAGESETLTLKGNWDHGAHKISVTFLNDAQGADGGDRNLFVDGISFGGKAIAHGTAELWDNGSVSFTAAATAAAPAKPAPSAGSGTAADSLVLKVSGQSWEGDAQFTVSIDGKQVGGIYTASADHWAGETEALTLKGNWNQGEHTVSVNFLNDAQGADGGDRNLFVDGISFGGHDIANSTAELWDNGHFDLVFG
jgi:hypothetical protein